ncbi:metallophosphatase family protein [Deinococcus sp. Marseille-Q6407]|uniref:metallophosphatase family protein n=1 Tax=Deinococcus sp. Marseille-Q6407 TaxID=2969223 RepID=UPI0021C0866E|nr:metallophosphatase family protein [Deinococcus sp. Marseille-Q6407]
MSADLRLAVLSDVHGNAFAAQSVIQDIRSCAPDLTVNLGDQVWGQTDPLRALEQWLATQLPAPERERLAGPAAKHYAGRRRSAGIVRHAGNRLGQPAVAVRL